jgi:dCMP deaminase
MPTSPENKIYERPSIARQLMAVAHVWSARATCPRKRVGAVIAVSPSHIVTTGFNGSLAGERHCDDVGCDMEDGHCVRTVHAEANAILQAAKLGISVEGATLYTTAYPCWPCFKMLVSAGIKGVVFAEDYRLDQRVVDYAKRRGLGLYVLRSEDTVPRFYGE